MTNTPHITLDARNRRIGRLASRCATLLMGKTHVATRPHAPVISRVTVTHCAQMAVTKGKLRSKRYYRTSGHPGGLRSETLGDVFEKNPSEALRRAVHGMLPRNRLHAQRMRHLDLQN